MPGKLRAFWNTIFGQSSAPSADRKIDSNSYAYEIGLATGAMGGTVYDAAKLQYVLSRVVPAGQKPSAEQISRAIGMLGGGVPEAVIIDSLIKKR